MTLLASTNKIRNMERMVVELSPYMNVYELDKTLEFVNTITNSKFDINPSVDDCKMQMKLILGSERYEEVVRQWTANNQPLLKDIGKTQKYRRKSDGTYWDGLDPEDNPDDYEIYYV